MRRICVFALIINTCALIGQGQQWKPLLQESYPREIQFTARYGIAYQSNGFDTPKRKIIAKKTPKYLRQMGAAHLIEGFQIFSTALTENPDNLPQWIDESWEEIKRKWVDCGGQHAQAANSFNPRRLLVVVEAAPFQVQNPAVMANGAVERDGRTIRVVNVTTSKLFSDPQNAYLVLLPDLLRWEMGNAMQVSAGLWDKTIAGEIGSRSPCR
jgi:hypothetical protein